MGNAGQVGHAGRPRLTDIICAIMKSNKVAKLRRELESLRRRGGIKPNELESLARSLGRAKHPRGSEPTWVSEEFPNLRPVSIPHHGGRDLNRFTAGGILDQLEVDLDLHEAQPDDLADDLRDDND